MSTRWAAASPTAPRGVFYAARERATAVAETRYHHARFLAATAQGPMHLPMRLYHVAIDARLHDLRPAGRADAAVHDPDDYAARARSGAPARRRARPAWPTAACAMPVGSAWACSARAAPAAATHAAYLLYAWDGREFTDVYEKTAMTHPLRRRFDRLDALRGVAIVWMALFHFGFDLNHFGLLEPRQNFYRDPLLDLAAHGHRQPVPVLRRPGPGAGAACRARAGRASGAAGRRWPAARCWSAWARR
jgi:hypothetical protein